MCKPIASFLLLKFLASERSKPGCVSDRAQRFLLAPPRLPSSHSVFDKGLRLRQPNNGEPFSASRLGKITVVPDQRSIPRTVLAPCQGSSKLERVGREVCEYEAGARHALAPLRSVNLDGFPPDDLLAVGPDHLLALALCGWKQHSGTRALVSQNAVVDGSGFRLPLVFIAFLFYAGSVM
jgi:hypothetical protein